MIGKPANRSAVYLAAVHCTHPDLDGIDAHLLGYLAHYTSGISGANSFPGNRNIADALKLSDPATDVRLRKNIERELIARTYGAKGKGKGGRGKASVYLLNLASPFFPNHTPGGQRLTEPTDNNEETPCADKALIDKETPCLGNAFNSGSALSGAKKRIVESKEAHCLDPISALSGQAAITCTSSTHPHPPPKRKRWRWRWRSLKVQSQKQHKPRASRSC